MNETTDTEILGSSRDQFGQGLEAENSDRTTTKPRLEIAFLALDGDPIEKMGVAVRWEGGEELARTDKEGGVPPIEAPPGERLSIAVQRFDGSYKKIGECCMPSSDGVLTIVSPNIVIETTTEKHEGKPGTAEERIPKSEQGDLGDLTQVSATDSAATQSLALDAFPISSSPESDSLSTAAKPQKKGTAKKAAATPVAVAKQQSLAPPQNISGRKVEKPKPDKNRDANGNPLAVITQKTMDWWNSWRMPTLNLWGAPEKRKDGGTTAATPVSVNAEMVKKVEALLAFAREQTEYLYTEGTAGVLAAMNRGTFKHAKGEKQSFISRGLCYTYVKVALARCNIVNGMLEGVSASGAEPALIARGFREVTTEVPDARWAAAGDVIVYAWSNAAWDKRKHRNPDVPNHGHIDIRDYQYYISDYLPRLFHPNWSDYDHVRIYRKVFDLLPTQRIRAFLRCLREFECQEEHDDKKRYQMLNAALPGGERRFTSYKTHPWAEREKPARGSTAAGAYQIMHKTWAEIFDNGLIRKTEERFSPLVQDQIAVIKLEDRGVLHMIRAGQIKESLEYCTPKGDLALASEWSSLPGGKQNKNRLTIDKNPMDMTYFLAIFYKYLGEEKAK